MVYVIWLLFFIGLGISGFFLRRRMHANHLERQILAVRLATDLSRQIKVIPANLLSWPMRDGLAIVLESTAALVAGSPLGSLTDSLQKDARQLRASRSTAAVTLLPANIRRLFENLDRQLARAGELRLIGTREYALAHTAIVLAMELAGVDILVQEAQVAAVLKEKERSEQLKAQALAHCARLPAKTAEEVRRRVQATLAA
ncbi:MAG: hypothetical protein FJ194_14230 [Gammaproteobacteria bacterium]|nr:hypothetical protein [Gammaproteobacteria bacterium]